ncbi:MAG: DUF3426 domain-containing protein [Methylococcaceae bacterium]|nr:DUF3426 domain-containing protein [Methylococcaceae bacterium]
MFTQCPDCRKTYPITKKQLRGKKGKLYCTDCKKKFNASELLNQTSTALQVEAKAEYRSVVDSSGDSIEKIHPEINAFPADISSFLRNRIEDKANTQIYEVESSLDKLPWETDKSPFAVNWFAGSVLGCLLLLGQIVYFEAGHLSQNASYRPKIQKLVRLFGYELAVYENLLEFEVLQSSLNPEENNSYLFKAIINNQAAFKQRLPFIKLALLDFNEQPFAERIFSPEQYMSENKRTALFIEPDETIQANLKIAAPRTMIGGYHFDLIY